MGTLIGYLPYRLAELTMNDALELLQVLHQKHYVQPEILERLFSLTNTLRTTDSPQIKQLLDVAFSGKETSQIPPIGVPVFDLQEFLESQGINLAEQSAEFCEKTTQIEAAYVEEISSVYSIQNFLSSQIEGVQLKNEMESAVAEIHQKFLPVYEKLFLFVQNSIVELAKKLNVQKKKPKFPERTKGILSQWFQDHEQHPYPTEEEKKSLAVLCGITVDQVSVWFYNERPRRKRKKQY